MTRRSPFVLLGIFLTGMFGLGGCLVDRGVTGNPRYPTDYEIGGTYRAKLSWEAKTSGRTVRGHPLMSVTRNAEAAQYFDFPERWQTEGIEGLVPAGTHLEILRLELERSFELGNVVWVVARFLDGPYAGREVVLNHVSREVLVDPTERIRVPHVNPEMLEPVKAVMPAQGRGAR